VQLTPIETIYVEDAVRNYGKHDSRVDGDFYAYLEAVEVTIGQGQKFQLTPHILLAPVLPYKPLGIIEDALDARDKKGAP
jgi:hypothetical protein